MALLNNVRGMMNYRIICSLLGLVAFIFSGCMLLCLPWGLPAFGGGPDEARGVFGLLTSGVVSLAIGLIFSFLGRGADESRLFRKEAIVIVACSWIMAIFLGALPYLFSGTDRGLPSPTEAERVGLSNESQRDGVIHMSFCDAIFESASGLTTTGATVFSELENPELLPRTILFWRSMTHFLGGLGVMCFFVTLLGQGANGKAILKLERTVSGAVPAAKMRTIAFYLFLIYASLTLICFICLKFCGMTNFDAISHAFSVVALGGFSTQNASIASYSMLSSVNGLAVECVLIFFMVVAGTNYWLIYWSLAGQPKRLFRDSEWRLYMCLLIGGVLLVASLGLIHGDYRMLPHGDSPSASAAHDPTNKKLTVNTSELDSETANAMKADYPDEFSKLGRFPSVYYNPEVERVGFSTALRRSAFQVVSLATGAGFATDRYELWNSVSLTIVVLLMFIGGCAGSTAGGAKVFRIVLINKAFFNNLAESFSPNVVRVTRLDGEHVNKDALNSAVGYVLLLLVLIFFTGALAIAIEPDTIWFLRGESQVEKTCDLFVASLSMFANVGPALGVLGSFDNFGALSDATKFLFSWAMLLGRLEILTVLTLLSPCFWRNR